MTSLSCIRTLLALTVLALALAACGSGESRGTGGPPSGSTTTSGGLPLFAGAKVVEDGSPMSMGINAIKDQLKAQPNGATATFDAYSLPAGTTFEQVKTFYDDALRTQGYTAAETMGAAAAAMPTTGMWLKDNGAASVTVTSVPGQAEMIILVMQVGK